MSRSSTPRVTQAWSESDSPTKPMPKFVLADASRLVEQAREQDEDQTVMMGAEENKKLLANVLALGQAAQPRPNTDDEPTLDTPAPLSNPDVILAAAALDLTLPLPLEPSAATPVPAPAPMPVRSAVAAPPVAPLNLQPPLAVALTLPAIVAVAPVSSIRPRITPQLAQAARVARVQEDFRRAPALQAPKRNLNVLVVGIWAFALSLCGVLMFLAMSG